MKRYKVYSDALKKTFGEKVYKIPIHLPCSCPNRDAITKQGGCIFCGDVAAGFEAAPSTLSIAEQANPTIELIKRKYKANRFILYFQNYTNTFMALNTFQLALEEASHIKDVVGLSISTRPDCVSVAQLELLSQLKTKGYHITIELGLQTPNIQTLRRINRGHGLAGFIGAVNLIHTYGFSVCTHLILNLPWDDDEDAIEAAELMSVLNVEEVKLHSLYILKGTVLGEAYLAGSLPPLISAEAYMNRVILFVEHLDSDIVIQRFFARAPEDQTLFCNWGHSWRKLKDMLDDMFEVRDAYQGRLYTTPHSRGLMEEMK
jgi:hypothetical protein